MVLLKSSDGLTFEVDEAAALQSQTIRHMIEDGCADSVIPVENVTRNILAKVIEYCNNHAEKVLEIDVAEKELKEFKIDVATKEPDTDEKNPKIDEEEELKTFDQEFVDADTNTLYDLIMAANFLDIKSLLDLTCQRVADMIKGKKPEEIRQIFNIENNFTPDQEEKRFAGRILGLLMNDRLVGSD